MKLLMSMYIHIYTHTYRISIYIHTYVTYIYIQNIYIQNVYLYSYIYSLTLATEGYHV